MAFRSLTDPLSRLKRSFYPERFLTGRIRNGELFLSCFSPGQDLPLWEEQLVSLSVDSPLPAAQLPSSSEERERLPFVLLWPYEQSITASLRLPPSVTFAEREAAIGALIELELPWPIEDTLLAWKSDPSEPASVHAWAILRTDLESWLSRLREASLHPRWVMPESLVIFDRFHPRLTDKPSRLLASAPLEGVIDSDGPRTLCILGRDGYITGEGSFLLPPSPPESREKRIFDLLLSFLAEGHTLPTSFLRGPEILPTPLLETISMPAEAFSGPTSRSAWGIVSSASGEESRALSFLKGPLTWQGDRKERKAGFRVLLFLTLLLIAMLILDGSVHLSRVNHRLDEAKNALDLAASRAMPGHRIIEPVGQLTQELASLDRQKSLLSQGPDIIRIMRDLTTAPPKGVSYELISLDVTRRFFTVSGKTDSFRSVDALIKSFSASGHMRDLAIQSAGLDIDRKTVTFRLRGRHD